MQDDIVALFAYDRWANAKVLGACRKLSAEQYVAEEPRGRRLSSGKGIVLMRIGCHARR
jgi:uncharacterized damage-inducible protein DinB